MNVGVLFINALPTDGGGFTFDDEIYQRLLEQASGTRHRFVVLSRNRVNQPKSPQSPIKFVTLPNVPTRRHGSSMAHRLCSKARHVSTKLLNVIGADTQSHSPDPVLRELHRHKIELLWIVNPWSLRPGNPFVEFPYITTVWDLQHRLQPFFPEVSCDGRWEFRESVFGTSLRRATYVLTGTEAGKAEIERFYQVPAERIRIVPLPTPGFALDSASSDVTTVLAKYCIRGQYVFYPAQFWPHKNHVGVLRAIQILKEKHDLDFSAVFVGADHGNLEHVKGLAQKLGISDRAYFLRFVSREELVALYRGALCLVYVSYFGPDNLPPLEAFALGCPVLASAVNGSREQLGDAALLVDPADHDAIAGGINRLQKEPSLRSVLVEQGFARARRFTGSDFVRKVFELLNEFEAVRSCWPSGGYRPISP